ncbi:hypothetical protein SDC9_104053 [bioreactor metagenome]|uniref:Uncharacterized protein n=1 Tax=bioreactor metagenome TaxID=1076179 RepID=A0A645AY41_9ZZZZ
MGDILEAHQIAFAVIAYDDVAEFLGRLEPALDIEFVLKVFIAVFGPDGAGRRLDVLRLHGIGNVFGRNAETGHPDRVEPDAHAVDQKRQHFGRTHAFDPRQRVLDGGIHIIVQLQYRELPAVGHEDEYRQHVGGAFVDIDTDALDIFRQLGFGTLERILDIDHGHVGVGSAAEGDRTGIIAGIVAGRRVVEQILHAVELILDRNGDGFRHHPGAGAGVIGRHLNLRRCDFGIFRHRKMVDRKQPGQHHHQADHDCEARSIDEEFRKHLVQSSCATGATLSPGITLWVPSTITVSPAWSPVLIRIRSPRSLPSLTSRRTT